MIPNFKPTLLATSLTTLFNCLFAHTYTYAQQVTPVTPELLSTTTEPAKNTVGEKEKDKKAAQKLDAITVTGRRPREYSDEPIKGYVAEGTSALGFELELQQVPATISILSADFLKDAGVKKLADALNLLPGVSVGDNGGSPREGILIRGYSASPTVNGIPQAVGTRPKFSFINIERIEVIKGIAGVEGNVDDFGGTIDLVTKKPQRENQRSVSVAFGDYRYKAFSADITGALTADGSLQYRLIGGVTQPQNWRPGLPERNVRTEFFPSLNWDYAPGGNVLVELSAIKLNDPLDRGGLYIEGAGFKDNLTPREWGIHQKADTQTQNFRQVDLTWNHRFSSAWSFKLNAQSSRNRERTRGFRNGETEGEFLFAEDGITWNGIGVDIPISYDDSANEHRSDGATAELRSKLTFGGVQHQLRAAISASKGSSIYGFAGEVVPVGFYPATSNTVNLFTPTNNQTANIIGQEGPNYLFFRDITKKRSIALQWLAEWTPRFRTLVGVRKETTDRLFGELGGSEADIGFAPFSADVDGLRSRALRVGGSFDIASNLSVFATYGDGSFAQSAITRDERTISDPRLVINAETGAKWSLAGGKLLATASVYQLREKNLLTGDCLPTELDCRAQKLVGGRRVRGVEIDVRGEVNRELRIGAGLALQDARIIESPDRKSVV